MKKIFLYLVIFVTMFLAVNAYNSFTYEVVKSDNIIRTNETANYVLKITNTHDEDSQFNLKFPNSDWITRTVPLTDYIFTLNPGKSKLVNITFNSKLDMRTGPYKVPIFIQNLKTSESTIVNVPLQLLKSEAVQYVPVIRLDVEMDYEIDPRNEIDILVRLENLNFRQIQEVNLELSSILFNENRTINLEPKDDKTEVFRFNIDDKQIPLNDFVKVKISTEAEKIYSWDKRVPYQIISYNKLIKDPKKDSSFLKKISYLNLKNDANIQYTYIITEKLSWLNNIFTSMNPSPSYIMNSEEGRFVVWEIQLDSDEELQIQITSNYRLIAVIIFIILLSIILYYVLRPPIVIKKEVAHVGTSEGGISEIKVILFIKNRTKQIVEDIIIIEKVPHIANVGKEFQVGTIRPSKVIQNPKKGTLVKWELQNLESHEERIITYKIKSKLSILGGMTLPATLVKYSKKGRTSKTKSNRLVLEG